MPSVVRAAQHLGSLVILATAVAGCSSTRPTTSPRADQRLTPQERIAHLLSRLTFGPRAGDAERVAAMGVDRWIDQQLNPESIPDSALDRALASLPDWRQPASQVGALSTAPAYIANMPMAALMKDSAAKAKLAQIRIVLASAATTDLFYAGKIAHAEASNRQLLEVVTDFWENHFSVYNGKMPSREALVVWDRDVLRPHALGKFRDLLGAVAHSPAMLYYLDNQLSMRGRINENYARELMELHTLGVDGGYTQKDVQEVARALTGWTIKRTATQQVFTFLPNQHDTATKVVLGHTLRGGRGVEDGEEVLDILARHPSTARHISFKLARRLVSDEPPPALVARAAATFMRTDGDIAAVVRTIVTSPEFFSRAAFRAKVKTPFELAVSTRRVLDAVPDTTPTTARSIAQLGQPTFGWQTPDGWPERGDAWMNSGAIYRRIKFAGDVADGRVATASPTRWHSWAALSTQPIEGQVDGVVNGVLGGIVDSTTRQAMLAATGSGPGADGAGARRLREVLSIALSSPEFQRR